MMNPIIQPYKDPWLSLVRYVKNLGAKALAQNLVPVLPLFVNLDAHANINDLPHQDFLCISGYSVHTQGQLFDVYCEVGVSTYNDPDNLRHIDLMNLVVNNFLPLSDVFIYSNGDPANPATVMTVAGDIRVDPTERGDVRTLQVVSLRLLPKASVAPGPRL